MHLFQINCSVEHFSQKKGMEVVDEQQEQGGAGAAGGDAEYAVVQGAFATGFSVPGRTTPGFTIRWEGDVQNRTLLKVHIGFLGKPPKQIFGKSWDFGPTGLTQSSCLESLRGESGLT